VLRANNVYYRHCLLQTLGYLEPFNHKKDYSGPYHGYDGFAIFARDMDLALNSPTWSLIGAPWSKKAEAKATAKATA
jgi:nitrogenase molybdenum-iron protein alpha/beta subunit